jgi:ABC-type nitrate/sulfonate/bicarbonate transport system permease component
MTAARLVPPRALPAVVGLGSGVLLLVAVEMLVRLGAINRFIVPLPSEVIASFARVVTEEIFRAACCRRRGNALPQVSC